MRNFKRLLAVFVVSSLLAGLAFARPAGAINPSNSQSGAVSTLLSRPGSDAPRFYFGTVVRDTADDQGVRPSRWQGQPQVTLLNPLWTWSWLSILIHM